MLQCHGHPGKLQCYFQDKLSPVAPMLLFLLLGHLDGLPRLEFGPLVQMIYVLFSVLRLQCHSFYYTVVSQLLFAQVLEFYDPYLHFLSSVHV